MIEVLDACNDLVGYVAYNKNEEVWVALDKFMEEYDCRFDSKSEAIAYIRSQKAI
jgi:hypothetical protein